MTIYLMRHGETEYNRLGYYNNEDQDLNKTGLAQAEELKKIVAELDYDVCFCSPSKRAKHTAEIINQEDKIIIPTRLLKERNPRVLNGKPLSFTDREEYWDANSQIDYGAESMGELFKRVNLFIDDLKERPYNSVLIVTHSGVTKAFYNYFVGRPEDGKFLHLGLKNCEVKTYELIGERTTHW